MDRDHNSCLSRDRLRKAIAQGAVKLGCLGELKVKRKTHFAVSLPLFRPTDCRLDFSFSAPFFSPLQTTAEAHWSSLHGHDQTLNLHEALVPDCLWFGDLGDMEESFPPVINFISEA